MKKRFQVKHFFGFHWTKLIIPLILIMGFLISFGMFSSIGNNQDKIICPMKSIIEESIELHNTKDTLSKEQLEKRIELLETRGEKIKESTDNYLEAKIQLTGRLSHFYMKINPFFPVSCEQQEDNSPRSCRFYINKRSYNCILNTKVEMSFLINLFEIKSPQLIPYKTISFFDVMLNIVYLFVVGYILSCFVGVIIRLVKKNK